MTAASERPERETGEVALRNAAQAMVDDHQTSETHHPDHILVPKHAFDRMVSALATPLPSGGDQSQEARVVKPLFWRKGTDHPQDAGAKWVANGIGGRYTLERQRDGTWLLWWAHDEFIWEACATIAEGKAKAEADWQARYAALSVQSEEGHG